MGKHLSIVYDGKTFFDGEVGKFQWTENANGDVEVKADMPRAGLFEKLAANQQKRQALSELTAGSENNDVRKTP